MDKIQWEARRQPDLERYDDVLTYLRARFEPQLQALQRVSLSLRLTEYGQPGAFMLPSKDDRQHYLVYYQDRPAEVTSWCFREAGQHPSRRWNDVPDVPWILVQRTTDEGKDYLDYLCQVKLATPEDQIVWGTTMAMGRVLQDVQVETSPIRRMLERLAFQELCCWHRWATVKREPAVC